MSSGPMMHLSWFVILLALIIFVAAVIGIVLWLVLRKRPQPRGFEVMPVRRERPVSDVTKPKSDHG